MKRLLPEAAALPVLLLVAVPSLSLGQQPPQNSPANLPASAPSAVTPPVARDVSWKLLVPNILDDQERVWTFPARLVHGQNWIPTFVVIGTTAALVALDPTEASYFRRTSSFNGFNNTFSGNATSTGMLLVPVALYAAGLVRKDSKMTKTVLFAGEAVADSEILTTFLKDATKRARPAGIPPGGNFSDSWWDSSGSLVRGNGSFPSGHTIAAFSVATIVARRYGNHRWVPYAAYGMAALVGFSRLSLSAHFTSDVFLGAALGYSISRFTVLRQ
jgi:membrane-associated phospholipid phosphatase